MNKDKKQVAEDAARVNQPSSDAKKQKNPSRRHRRRCLRAAPATEASYLLSLRR